MSGSERAYKGRSPRFRGAFSVLLFGVGLLLLVLSFGGLPVDLNPQLIASFAIISLALGLRIASGSSKPVSRVIQADAHPSQKSPPAS